VLRLDEQQPWFPQSKEEKIMLGKLMANLFIERIPAVKERFYVQFLFSVGRDGRQVVTMNVLNLVRKNPTGGEDAVAVAAAVEVPVEVSMAMADAETMTEDVTEPVCGDVDDEVSYVDDVEEDEVDDEASYHSEAEGDVSYHSETEGDDVMDHDAETEPATVPEETVPEEDVRVCVNGQTYTYGPGPNDW